MIALTKVSETATKITLGWTPPGGDCVGYAFFADNKRVSNSWDPAKSQVTFSKGPAKFRVDVLDVQDTGTYPPPANAPVNIELPTINVTG